jgi:molybdopterin synthase sulfur carrier subunit
MNTITLLYFASIREELGLNEEQLTLPAGVHTIAELIAWLAGRGENWADIFSGARVFRVAINQEVVPKSAAIPPGAEVAIFPPVTGG